MKDKVHYLVQPRQSLRSSLPALSMKSASEQARNKENVQQEIDTFLQALDSYPACATRDPQVSFQQHLRSIFDQKQEGADDKDGKRNISIRRP